MLYDKIITVLNHHRFSTFSRGGAVNYKKGRGGKKRHKKRYHRPWKPGMSMDSRAHRTLRKLRAGKSASKRGNYGAKSCGFQKKRG